MLHATSFYDGMLKTVIQGGDTDTNGAITGALLSARFGINNIPVDWLKSVKSGGIVLNSRNDKRNSMSEKDIEFLKLDDIDPIIDFLHELCETRNVGV